MSKFDDIKEALHRRFGKEDEPSDGNASMTEGTDETVYGIKRKFLYMGVGVLVVGFISFMYFSSATDDLQNKKQQDQHKEEAANQQQLSGKNGMPNDYEQLQQMNAKRMGQNPQQPPAGKADNGTAANNSNGQQQAQNPPPAATLPQIPQRSYSQNFVPTVSAPKFTPPAAAPVAGAKEDKEKYSSAISFGVGGKDDNKGTQVADAGTSAPTAGLGANSVMPTSYDGADPASSLIAGTVAYTPLTPNSLQAGTVIPAVLLNGVNTELGGQVIAQVECDVYDSMTGATVLIPSGSRLIGKYDNNVKGGQGRVAITWQQLQLPTGGSYALGNSMIAADLAGYAGLPGHVHSHSGSKWRAGIFTTALAALGAIATNTNANTANNTYTTGQLAQQGAMSNLINSASNIFNSSINQNSQPSISVKPGSEFAVYVTQTIQLNPYTTAPSF